VGQLERDVTFLRVSDQQRSCMDYGVEQKVRSERRGSTMDVMQTEAATV
jgi:hypothetical protein